ncbi:unnamed protein product, partial [Linum tenue]
MDGLVAAWLPGTEGRGVTDVLFGDYGFTGKLPRTWFRRVDQLPMNVGDKHYDPLFPFGFGLTTEPVKGKLRVPVSEQGEWWRLLREVSAGFAFGIQGCLLCRAWLQGVLQTASMRQWRFPTGCVKEERSALDPYREEVWEEGVCSCKSLSRVRAGDFSRSSSQRRKIERLAGVIALVQEFYHDEHQLRVDMFETLGSATDLPEAPLHPNLNTLRKSYADVVRGGGFYGVGSCSIVQDSSGIFIRVGQKESRKGPVIAKGSTSSSIPLVYEDQWFTVDVKVLPASLSGGRRESEQGKRGEKSKGHEDFRVSQSTGSSQSQFVSRVSMRNLKRRTLRAGRPSLEGSSSMHGGVQGGSNTIRVGDLSGRVKKVWVRKFGPLLRPTPPESVDRFVEPASISAGPGLIIYSNGSASGPMPGSLSMGLCDSLPFSGISVVFHCPSPGVIQIYFEEDSSPSSRVEMLEGSQGAAEGSPPESLRNVAESLSPLQSDRE